MFKIECGEVPMFRRVLLKGVAALAAGSGIVATGAAPVFAAQKKETRVGQFIRSSDGTDLFFRDWGRGRAIVLLAPWSLNSAWWEYRMADLADAGFRCVAYDRRGHGRSAEPTDGYTFDTLADDLRAVLEELELSDVTLVGHSMGCGEVVRYLSRHGSDRIARIVLVSTITPFMLKTDDNPDARDATIIANVRKNLTKDRAHAIAAAAPAFFGVPKNSVSQEIMDWWVRMMVDQCSLRVQLVLHKMSNETDFRPELRKISLPTLLIHGDIDVSAVLEITARKTAPLISGCLLKVYEDAAHGLPITHADRLNADLIAFANS